VHDGPSPEAAQLIGLLRSARAAAEAAPRTLDQRRADLDGLAARWPLPAGVATEVVDEPGVRGLWLTPEAADRDRCLLYLHGGGYTRGSVTSHGALAARLATAAGTCALVLGYRLAPEHPFPAALDDATAAFDLVVGARGIAPARTAIAGDSAGGGLTVATMLRLRDGGRPPPGGAVLLSPWLDLRVDGVADRPTAALDPMLSPADLRRSAAAYLAGHPEDDPLVSPIVADLRGLPPMLVLVGTEEVLLQDADGFARRAATAGTDVRLVEGPGLFHVWPIFPGLPESAAAVERAGSFLREVTGGA